MEKIAIVASEGGMSCAYSVGVLTALVEKYNFTNPYVVIGSSGSTGSLAYYVAGQYSGILNIWKNLLPVKEFLDKKRLRRIIDIDYLIDVVFSKQEILNVEKVKSSPIKFLIGTTEVNGALKYFTNFGGEDSILEALRASSAMPVFFNKEVEIKGHCYIDGAFAANLYQNISKVRELGAEKIIVIDNCNYDAFGDFLAWIYSFFRSKDLGRVMRAQLKQRPFKSSDSDLIILRPTTKLPASTLDNNREHIIKTIDIGYYDAVNNSEIKSLLSVL